MALFEILTEIDIAATPEKVWSTLTDFETFPLWNPFVRSVAGRPVVGSRLQVTIQPPRGKPMRFSPTVLAVEAPRELRWLGQLLFPGVFDGEHYFQVTALDQGGSRFVHGERFSGFLVGIFRKSLDRDTRAGFVAMNAALKARVERGK